ncbi:HET-domain-containing protein [Hypoxylon sp. FL0890]|nr:HET-domain-containing protein [Hypoxylon sp. FL0890]
MLRLRGRVEAPKQFFVSPSDHSKSCQLCERLFNEDLYERLRSSDQGLTEAYSSSELLATELYHSVLGGCRLCAVLGNSIITAAQNETSLHGEETFIRYIPWYQGQKAPATTPVKPDSSQSNDDSHGKGAAHAYFTGAFQSHTGLEEYLEPRAGENEPDLTFQSLDCAAKILLKMTIVKGDYSTGFDLININIEAIPSEKCSKPWIFIPPYGATLWLEVISDAGWPFSQEWKTLSAAGGEWPLVVRRWLDNCQQSHQCAIHSTFRPTRLIDVGDPLHPHLIVSAAQPDDWLNSSEGGMGYVTLSYVWGAKQDYVLTQDTLQTKLAGLDTTRIPQSVMEAMEVTRRLGFRYIWVDALCIIQDSREDKLKELPMMAKIYQHSALTISAASSTSCSEGFLKPPQPALFKVQPFQITIGKGEPQFPYINLSLGFREEAPDVKDPIDSRGWTLQEWALSSCRLRFSSRGIQWTCNKLVADPSALSGEEHRDPPIQFSPEGYVQNYFGEASAIISSLPELNERLSHRYTVDETYKRKEASMMWIEIRSQYAQRSLSFPSDKLSAISAIAAIAAEENGMTYVAGLWKEALLTDLQWYYIFRSNPTAGLLTVAAGQEYENEYIAPSWSWASVRYDNGSLYPKQSRKWTTDRPWHMKILGCGVDLIDGSDFSFGPMKSGYLDIEGRILDVEWELWTENTVALNKLQLYDSPRQKSNEQLGQAFLDFPSSCLEKGLKFRCLILTKAELVYNQYNPERYPEVICARGLLLLPLHRPNTYRRIGLCYLNEGGLWEESTAESIRIV